MENKMNTGNAIVDAISTIDFAGNITPLSWYREILMKNGRVDFSGIAVLSDVVYWYRPSIAIDETDKKIVRKKFRRDLLQRSYAQISERLNLTEDQAKKAVKRLEERGFIKRHFRTEIHNGTKCANVMYLELIPERIKEITYVIVEDTKGVSVNKQTPICIETDTSLYTDRHVTVFKETPPCIEEGTKTENTTKTSTKDYTSINLVRDGFKNQIEYETYIKNFPSSKDLVDEIVEIATEILSSTQLTMKVNGEERPMEYVKERICHLDFNTIEYVVDSIRGNRSKVTNVRTFIISTLYNAPATMDLHYQLEVNYDEQKV